MNITTTRHTTLKGGLNLSESPFAKLYEIMQVPDSKFKFQELVDKAAENLANQYLLLSAAYEASRESWQEAAYAEFKWSKEHPPFDSSLLPELSEWSEWACTCRQWQQEQQEATTVIEATHLAVQAALLDLIDLMGRWFAKLNDPAVRYNRAYKQEQKMILAAHKYLMRRFDSYKKALGGQQIQF